MEVEISHRLNEGVEIMKSEVPVEKRVLSMVADVGMLECLVMPTVLYDSGKKNCRCLGKNASARSKCHR